MNEEQFEKIERYAHGEMSRQERLHFEAELLVNKELAANTEAYQMVEGEMKDYDKEAALKASLQSIGASFIGENEASLEQPATKTILMAPVHAHLKAGNGWKRWTAAAAIIVVVIASAGVYYYVRQKNTGAADVAIIRQEKGSEPVASQTDTMPANHPRAQPPAIAQADTPEIPSSNTNKKKASTSLSSAVLFNQYFTADALPEDEPGALQEAFDDYDNKNYPDAISAINDADLEQVTRGQQIPPELTKWYAYYYKGICYLALDSIDSAIAELENAANIDDSLLLSKAQWYLALSYLKADKVQRAKSLLNQIAANNSTTYNTKAQSLLQQLEKEK